jgi:TetR/AcrR family transcriptional regulator
MTQKDLNTEEKILEAAAQEFLEKGRAGARMQVIADSAGINKALLHYYYRSKDLLFETVFSLAIKKLLLPKITAIIEKEDDVFNLIRNIADSYIAILNANPSIPFFIIDEIQKNPHRLPQVFIKSGLPIQRVFDIVNQAIEKKQIKPIDPRQLFVNLISMSIFPLIARNMLQPVLFENDPAAYNRFLESRRKEVAGFIIDSIKLNQ